MSKVFLHVGTPKTGTSLLQDVLFRNKDTLRRAGVLYPAQYPDDHFRAALDLTRLPWDGLPLATAGAWDRVAAQAVAHDGTTIISHEILARATPSETAYAMECLGDAETHLVISARDLARQIPAEWQENVKSHYPRNYGTFMERLRDPSRTWLVASWFWAVQELPDIINRWGADLPPERIHVVTVPPRGTPLTVLLGRFVEAFGLGGLDLEFPGGPVNSGLGPAEAALLNRLNPILNERLSAQAYADLVGELLARRTLAERPGRLELPPQHYGWVRELSESWVADLRRRQVNVIGDLDELIAQPPTAFADPDEMTDLTEPALDALVVALEEAARARAEAQRLRDERAGAGPRRTRKERLYDALDRTAPGRWALEARRRRKPS